MKKLILSSWISHERHLCSWIDRRRDVGRAKKSLLILILFFLVFVKSRGSLCSFVRSSYREKMRPYVDIWLRNEWVKICCMSSELREKRVRSTRNLSSNLIRDYRRTSLVDRGWHRRIDLPVKRKRVFLPVKNHQFFTRVIRRVPRWDKSLSTDNFLRRHCFRANPTDIYR